MTSEESSSDDAPYVPTGAQGDADDLIGKLDELIGRHKPRLAPEMAPVLTESLQQAEDTIPTLTEIVSRPAPQATESGQHGLENALVQRLAMRLEVEKARLLAEGTDADRAALLDELIARLRESLPDLVRVAIERDGRR